MGINDVLSDFGRGLMQTNTWQGGIAQGLNNFDERKKKAGLAQALQGMSGSIPDNLKPYMQSLVNAGMTDQAFQFGGQALMKKMEMDAKPQGAFQGTGMDAQVANILIAAEQNPALKATPQYKIAVAQYMQPKTAIGPNGQTIMIQPTLPDFGGHQSIGQRPQIQPTPQPRPQTSAMPSGVGYTATPVAGTGNPTLPAEVAARVGLANAFLANLPNVRKEIEAGALSGGPEGSWSGTIASRTKMALNTSKEGELKRSIAEGADALLRNLTGAGMPATEAARYVARYEPDTFDTNATIISKLNGLEWALKNVGAAVLQGRDANVHVNSAPPASNFKSNSIANVATPAIAAPKPQGSPPKIDTETQDAINSAKAAVAAGKDPALVAQRLRDYGIDPTMAGL